MDAGPPPRNQKLIAYRKAGHDFRQHSYQLEICPAVRGYSSDRDPIRLAQVSPEPVALNKKATAYTPGWREGARMGQAFYPL